MANTLVECFELLIEAEQLAPRLDAAAAALAQLPGLDDEKAWLAAACGRLASARDPSHRGLLDRALRLAELDGVKAERGKLIQGALADEVERTQAAIVVAGGPRSPLLDVVFDDLKVPPLRKAARREVEKFCAELERRLTSSYAQRLLAGTRYRSAAAPVQELLAAMRTWREVFVEPPLDDEAAAPLRDELVAGARAVELPVRQARLLAQAALLPAADLLDAAGVVTARGKRKGKDEDSHPILERDPPDPLLPTAAEREELAALHAAAEPSAVEAG